MVEKDSKMISKSESNVIKKFFNVYGICIIFSMFGTLAGIFSSIYLAKITFDFNDNSIAKIYGSMILGEYYSFIFRIFPLGLMILSNYIMIQFYAKALVKFGAFKAGAIGFAFGSVWSVFLMIR